MRTHGRKIDIWRPEPARSPNIDSLLHSRPNGIRPSHAGSNNGMQGAIAACREQSQHAGDNCSMQGAITACKEQLHHEGSTFTMQAACAPSAEKIYIWRLEPARSPNIDSLEQLKHAGGNSSMQGAIAPHARPGQKNRYLET